ncbi:programmed cell death protein 2 [Mycena epipterygia]|nr:programmed cell death protein 2 [Mycena epipterygia]
MPPIDVDDWSSDEVVSEDVSVLLGTPDGAITAAADLVDAAASRIGGHLAFPPSNEPPFSSSPMELLVQMWCPFENSSMDRALYVWRCGLPGQGGQPTGAPNPTPFGLGAQIFGDSTASAAASPPVAEDETSDAESNTGSDEELLTALVATTLHESPWRSAPSYPPLYLSTCSEYLPAQTKIKLPPGVQIVDPINDSGKGGKDVSWISEAYENSLDVDQVFERFTKRVGYEGDQCTSLPYASDKVLDSLFPMSPAPFLPVTKAAFTVVPPAKRTYNPSSIPPCSVCKSKRVFECQLMPNLINVLRAGEAENKSNKLTDEERRKLVEQELKRNNSGASRGMEWGTCLIFSCSKDCSLNDDGKEARESWREEMVFVQWGI